MAIIDRDQGALADADLEALAAMPEARGPGQAPGRTGPFALSDAGRLLLAVLSAGAGAIHLAMVPAHAAEWTAEGIAFAAAGWFQVVFAVVIVARPSRVALRVACLANVVFIGAWVVTRIWGPPFGPETGVPHAASFVDITCVVFETALVATAVAFLFRPDLGARLSSGARTILSVVPVGILLLASAAIVSPSASGHAHAEVGGAGAHDHGTAAGADDKGLSAVMNGQGDGGGHSHTTATVELDRATKQQLDAQLARTAELVAKYPTVADAMADGYYRQGPFAPGLGAHYMSATTGFNADGTLEGDDFVHPTLIYDGITPDSRLAGFMYLIYSTDTQNPPEGFAGPNDHWHYHTNVCLTTRPGGGFDAPLGADTTATKELCDKYGGSLIPNTGYMLHVWTVPGYESSQGTFSNVNPQITCPDGTYYVVPPEEIGNRSNICRDVPG